VPKYAGKTFSNRHLGMKVYTKLVIKISHSQKYRVPTSDIHNCTSTSPDGNIHNQIDHILTDRRRLFNLLETKRFLNTI
jgi:hypothetical protein